MVVLKLWNFWWKGVKGYTALTVASRYDYLDIVKFLVERGADVNAKSDVGQTALIEASEWGRLDVVKLLVERGANIMAKDDDGWTALSIASRIGCLDIVKLLEKKIERREWNERVKRAIPRINLGIPLVIESLLLKNI